MKERFGDGPGVSKAMRQMIGGFRRKVEAKVEAEMDREPTSPQVELPQV